AQSFVESLLEGDWDPGQHPRAPKGGSDGGQWVAKGSGSTARGETTPKASYLALTRSPDSATNTPTESTTASFRGNSTPTTYASYTTSSGAPIYAAAAHQGGHHWVPQAVYNGLASQISREAFNAFYNGTKSPVLYDHAFDTWNGVTHRAY